MLLGILRGFRQEICGFFDSTGTKNPHVRHHAGAKTAQESCFLNPLQHTLKKTAPYIATHTATHNGTHTTSHTATHIPAQLNGRNLPNPLRCCITSLLDSAAISKGP